MAISEITQRRVKRIGSGMFAMSVFQLVLCALSVMLIIMTKDGNNPVDYKALVAAGFGGFTSLLGIIGGSGRLELVTRLYYVFNLWLLSTITTYLYLSIDEETQKQGLCSPSQASFSSSDNDCQNKLAMAKGKLSLGVISLATVFVCCILSVNFEDALDDYNDQKMTDKLASMRDEENTMSMGESGGVDQEMNEGNAPNGKEHAD